MKIPVWYLLVLLASVFTPGRGDCQGECVACGALLQQQQLPQAFNALVSVCNPNPNPPALLPCASVGQRRPDGCLSLCRRDTIRALAR